MDLQSASSSTKPIFKNGEPEFRFMHPSWQDHRRQTRRLFKFTTKSLNSRSEVSTAHKLNHADFGDSYDAELPHSITATAAHREASADLR